MGQLRNVYVQVPVRINGPTSILGTLLLCTEYPLTASQLARISILQDLNLRMLIAGRGDHRPFTEPADASGVARAKTATTIIKLTTRLGLVLLDDTLASHAPIR